MKALSPSGRRKAATAARRAAEIERIQRALIQAVRDGQQIGTGHRLRFDATPRNFLKAMFLLVNEHKLDLVDGVLRVSETGDPQ